MAKIHRNDMPVQHPTQTITLPKEPEPAAPKATAPQFYDQDKDADYEAPHPAKGKGSAAKAGKAKSKKDLAYTIAMVVLQPSSWSAAACWSSAFSTIKRPRTSFPTCNR